MAINNSIRLLSFGMLITLSTASAQDIPAAVNNTSQEASSASATLAEMPLPKAPKVTCAGGQLAISANNSTLGGVLTAVHECIGVQIDIPEGASGKRVFEDLGPGPERQIMELLLNGTNFNYVIGSSEANPQKIVTVLLLARTSDAVSTSSVADRTLTPARRAWLASRQNIKLAGTSGEVSSQPAEESSDTPAPEAAGAVPADNANTNPTPVPVDDKPAPVPDAPSAPTFSTPVPAPTSEAPSSPPPVIDLGQGTAEKITGMEQMFQQRRQMNQNQNSTTPQ